jgi:subtilisin-like proprotein convertase family protein
VEQGWVENAAQINFHNWYGFGLVDAGKAVEMAKTFKSLPVQTLQTVDPQSKVLSTADAVSSQAAKAAIVETVEVTVNLNGSYYVTQSVPYFGCLQFELTSPSNTKSILLNGGSGFSGWAQDEIKFLSNAFYGESAAGVWKISLKNICTSGNFYSPNANPTLTIRGR